MLALGLRDTLPDQHKLQPRQTAVYGNVYTGSILSDSDHEFSAMHTNYNPHPNHTDDSFKGGRNKGEGSHWSLNTSPCAGVEVKMWLFKEKSVQSILPAAA